MVWTPRDWHDLHAFPIITWLTHTSEAYSFVILRGHGQTVEIPYCADLRMSQERARGAKRIINKYIYI